MKHAFGLVTEGRRAGKAPVLLYLYAEPLARGAAPIPSADHARHWAEVEAFGSAVAEAVVRFASCSYGEWLAGWSGAARAHADALLARFHP